MPDGMTQAAYARYRRAKGFVGGTRQAVAKAIKTGRITLNAAGRLEPHIADAQWTANTGGPVPSPAPSSPSDQDARRAKARTELEELRAEQARLAVQKANGELVKLSAVRSAWRTVFGNVRTKVLGLPVRLADELAGLTDPRDVSELLDRELRHSLSSLSGEPPTGT